jgi:hypothetical protein
VRILALATFLILGGAGGAAVADDTLVMELPAFPGGKAAEAAAAAKSAAKSPVSLSMPTRNPAALVRSKQGGAVDRRGNPRGGDLSVGRLGVASRGASIYARKTSRSRSLSEVPAGTYVALTRT